MDFEKLIFSEKSAVAVSTLRKRFSVITFIFTLVVLVSIIVIIATMGHRLNNIENNLQEERSDVKTLYQRQKQSEAKIESFKVAPKLTTRPLPLRMIVQDSDYNLTCKASGIPYPNITWTRFAGLIPSSWVQEDGVLFIKGFQMRDAGNYYCTARNSLGEVVAHTILNYMKKEVPKFSVPKNCAEVKKSGNKNSGVYSVDPDGKGTFKVYCDQTTSGGGWTVFQKRKDGSVDFYRGWNDYKNGFGDLKGEFWLGLDKIYRLTHQTRNRLRVELDDWNGGSVYAEYSYFAVASEEDKYKLSLGTYSGNASDSLTYHKGMSFSTKDRDNDNNSASNCAVRRKGAWWYNHCHQSNLNGYYYHGGYHSSFGDGVNWEFWKGDHYSAKRTEMKIRPV